MRFTVSPASFADAVKAVSKVISKKPTMPVLSNILLRPGEAADELLLTGCDGDNTLTVCMKVDDGEDLHPMLLPADMVSKALGAVGQLPVTVEVEKNGEVLLSDFMGEYRFMGSADVAGFPQAPVVEGAELIIPALPLADLLSSAMRFTASDDLRPQMCGVLCEFGAQGTMTVAASDSKKLFCDTIGGVAVPSDTSVILPATVASILVGMATSGTEETVTVQTDGQRVLAGKGGSSIVARLTEGRFPRYQAVIPKNNDRVAELDRAQLIAAIDRAVIASNVATSQLKLSFDGVSTLHIESRDIDYSTSAKVRISTERQTNLGAQMAVGIRGTFLLDILKNAFRGRSKVILKMSDPTKAILVKENEESERTALIMPMQLTDF